jgi:hypothetical protein
MPHRLVAVGALALLAGCAAAGRPANDLLWNALKAQDCMMSPTCERMPDSVGFYVRGQVVVAGPLGLETVPFSQVKLLRDGVQVVAETSSDRSGNFLFRQKIPHGLYDLVLVSDFYQARQPLRLRGAPDDLVLLARPIALPPAR